MHARFGFSACFIYAVIGVTDSSLAKLAPVERLGQQSHSRQYGDFACDVMEVSPNNAHAASRGNNAHQVKSTPTALDKLLQ
ncbi:hypothetical protein GCM10009105_25430 [Dokdonella soli]|uniref:Secreted protein n=1 Tax=Dokdonella soli TaxID=529810 RepID=A0ABP3TUJ4_9GAMM